MGGSIALGFSSSYYVPLGFIPLVCLDCPMGTLFSVNTYASLFIYIKSSISWVDEGRSALRLATTNTKFLLMNKEE